MVNMSQKSRDFLAENLPEALQANTARDCLDFLYKLIDRKGFAPPDYDEYNDFGREAQRVYDDLYYNN